MNYPASRVAQLVTNVASTATVDTIFNGAASKNAGYLYVTNVSCDWPAGINTYGMDPTTSIWNEEIAKVSTSGASVNGTWQLMPQNNPPFASTSPATARLKPLIF